MGFGNIIIIILLTYYSKYVIDMIFSKKQRLAIQTSNKELNNLRKKSFKTLEEQKKFINIKYPKSGKFKFSWRMLPNIIKHIIMFVIFFRLWSYLIFYVGIEIALWQAIFIVILFPILLNLILTKFNIQKGDLRQMLKW